MMLFVFRVSISLCKNARFLAISLSMIEIACWSVSMTSTISASDLLKVFNFFGSHGLWLGLSSDTVGDMLVDLTQSGLLDRGERDDTLNLMLETFDAPSYGCFVDNPDNNLIESISLFESLFQRHAPDFGSHRLLYKL